MTLLKTHDSAATADKPRPARGSVSRTSIRRAHACRSHQRRGPRPRATEVPRDGLCLVYSFRMNSYAVPPAGVAAAVRSVSHGACAGMRSGVRKTFWFTLYSRSPKR